ncbi:MAG: secretin and TonB N-terminal domain-containing protein [Candidatus Omnitrophica bacterium]|nr:secretin and TonB N-terminal domain-containing protein [Candidatus Omnitrophota bacterium]
MNRKIFSTALISIAIVCFASKINATEDLLTGSSLLKKKYDKTISMDFKDAALNDVLKIFSQQSGLNFIAATSVADKSVNLYLDNVPVEEALERILSANDLTYEIKSGSNIFVVTTLTRPSVNLITRMYPLRHTSVPSSKIYTTLSTSSGGGSATSGILDAVKAILTSDGAVIEDTRTNSLVVSDIPSQFPIIEQTITKLDVRIPQILIEAEMLDINTDVLEDLGAKFGKTPVSFTGASKNSYFPFNTDNIIDDTVGANRQGVISSEYTLSTLSFAGFSAAVDFLKTKTDTRNLARPRILTLNNETAVIHIKTDEAIGLASTSNDSSSSSSTETTSEAERVETGVFLTVTPQANIYTGEITMAIEPKVVQARTGGTFGEGTNRQTFKDPEERGTRSILRVNNGDTVMLGGLLRTDKVRTGTSVPIISKIPILGMAFRHKHLEEEERELIIFITPRIVEDNNIPNILSSGSGNIVREQEIPTKRLDKINKELSTFEHQRF